MLLLLLFTVLPKGTGAQNITLTLKDRVTGQPVAFAYILIRTGKDMDAGKLITDENGKAVLDLSPPFFIEISSLGFRNYSDTIILPEDQTILLSPEYYKLDQVVVTGQFRAQPVDRSIYQLDVIDRKQIDLKAANNLGDLLRNDLSFQLRSEGVLGDFLRIRGLTGEHIRILIDGMPITGRMADRIELGQLSLDNVDHIEVIEGPMSVVYGSNALAGAINLITKENLRKSLLLDAEAYYETVGIYNFNLNISRKYRDHSFALNGGRNFYNGWGPIDTSRYKIWKPKLQYLGGAAYSYHSKRTTVRYHTDLLAEELRDQDSLSLENLYERALDAYHYTRRWNNSLHVNHIFQKDLLVDLQAGYSYYRKRKITYLNDLVNLEKTIAENPSLHDTTLFHLVSLRSILSNRTGKKFEYQAGFDYSYELAEGKRTQGQQNISEGAGFLNFIYHPWEVMSLQPGIRYIFNSKFKAPLVYALNLKANPGNLTLRASLAKGFRAPSIKQLYLEFIDQNHEIYGNPDLEAETGESFNASIDHTLNSGKHTLQLSGTGFYNLIINAIQLVVNTEDPGWGTYFNISGDPLRTKGMEVRAAYHFFPRISLDGGIITTGRNRIDRPSDFVYSTDIASTFKYFSPQCEYELAIFYKYTDDYLEFRGNFNADSDSRTLNCRVS